MLINFTRKIHYLRSKLFIPKFVQIEKENNKGTNLTKSVSSVILEKNGFITSSSANGLTTFLPLGKRVLNKMTEIIREEMNRIGQEISMPSLSDLSLWKKTKRDEIIGNELFKLEDRRQRELCLCPTHEEIITSLVSKFSKSLNTNVLGENQALCLYQITTKFRDEPQAKHGLLRGREFLMKDMYSFHLTDECARQMYDNVCKGYEAILNRLDIKYIKVNASTGAMGGSMSHEYQIESPIGEDTIYECKECGKAISSDLIDPNNKNFSSICDIIKCVKNMQDTVIKKTSIEVGHTFILGDRYTKVFPFESYKRVLMVN
jgi:prolyl-tRNA synthetase